MASILHFPDKPERTDREIRAEIVEFLRGKGVSAQSAEKASTEIVSDFRSLESELKKRNLSVTTNTDAELRLVTDAVQRSVDEFKLAYLEHRLKAEIQRLRP